MNTNFRSKIDGFIRTYRSFNIDQLFKSENGYKLFHSLSSDILKDDDTRCLIGRPRLILTDGKTNVISAAYLFRSFTEIKPKNTGFFSIYELLDLKFDKVSEKRLVDGFDDFSFQSLSYRYDQIVVDIETIKHKSIQDTLLSTISQYKDKSIVFVSKFNLKEIKDKLPEFIQYIEQHGKIIEFWKHNTPQFVVSKYLFLRGVNDCFFCKRDETQYYSRFGTQELQNMAKEYRLNEQELRDEVVKQSLKLLENKEKID